MDKHAIANVKEQFERVWGIALELNHSGDGYYIAWTYHGHATMHSNEIAAMERMLRLLPSRIASE